jgi:hypothetical protein
MKEKLRIITASQMERELDTFRETRHDELVRGNCPDAVFIREYPRIDPFAVKRINIRLAEDSLETSESEATKEFLKQRKDYVIRQSGNHFFSGNTFLSITIDDASNVDVFVKDVGLLFVSIASGKQSNVRLHIIGNIHTVFCDKECQVICYFVPHISHSLFYTEHDTDDVGKFFDNYDKEEYLTLFRSTGANKEGEISSPTAQTPRPSMTKVKNLHCNPKLIKGKSLVKIDNVIELK